MKVKCEHCQTTLSLKDDKLKPGAELTFTCPKCNQSNTVTVPEPEAPIMSDQTNINEELTEDDGSLGEFYEEGTKPALICFDPGPMRDRLKQAVVKLDYLPVIPSSTRDALRRIRLTMFNMILLDESYGGQTRENNAILRLLQPMDMAVRRRIFLALFGNDYHSLDHMAAYALSVNAVINVADEPQFDKILFRGLSEYERFYRVYFDVMREMGKS